MDFKHSGELGGVMADGYFSCTWVKIISTPQYPGLLWTCENLLRQSCSAMLKAQSCSRWGLRAWSSPTGKYLLPLDLAVDAPDKGSVLQELIFWWGATDKSTYEVRWFGACGGKSSREKGSGVLGQVVAVLDRVGSKGETWAATQKGKETSYQNTWAGALWAESNSDTKGVRW